MRRILIPVVMLFSAFIAGCPKPAKPEIKPGTASEEKKGSKFNSLLGEVYLGTFQDVDLTGLPKKLLYPKARPLARYGKYERPRWGCSYNLETPDPAEKVWDYYLNLLKDWKMAEEVKHERYTRRSFVGYIDSVDKEVVDITVTPEEGKTIIVIAHTYNEL